MQFDLKTATLLCRTVVLLECGLGKQQVNVFRWRRDNNE